MIHSFGWSDALSQAFAPFAAQGLLPGRIILQQRGLFGLATELGELDGKVSGRLAHQAEPGGFPAVGDWVACSRSAGDGPAVIQAVLPRRTAFIRKAAQSVAAEQVVAANVDLALLTASMNADFNARRLERYLATAWQSGAAPLVVLTKADIASDVEAAVSAAESVAFGVPVLAVSALTGQGMDELAGQLKAGQTAVLVGSSGVGKSSLVNALAGRTRMATAAIRQDDARGRHTTTHRELVLLPSGALILDTPGMRELGLIDAVDGLAATFDDIEALTANCRFRDCGHTNEPGCAVLEALETGALDEGRWRSYRKLERELAFQERKEDRQARELHRRHWIAVHKASRARKKLDLKP